MRKAGADLVKENPRAEANWLSAATFWYTLPTFSLGRSRDIEESDLTKPLEEHKSSNLGDLISKAWSKEVRRARYSGTDPSMYKVLNKCFRWEMIVYGLLLAAMEIGIRMFQPICLGLILRYFNKDNDSNDLPREFPTFLWRIIYYWEPNQCAISEEEALMFAAILIGISFVTVLVLHPYMMGVMHVGMKIRIACCSLIYRKALRISLGSLGGKTVGTVVTLMSTDVNRFDIAPIFLHYIWISPMQTLIILWLMYQDMKLSAFYGTLAVLVFIPFQAWLGHVTTELRRETAILTDERVRLMNEIIQGIQVIKMYAWEYAFLDVINRARRKEIKILRKGAFIKGIIMSFIMFTARSAIFLTAVTYVLTGNQITAEKLFVVVSYYQILRQTMTVYFPQGVAQTAEATVAVDRIRDFMMTKETDVGDPTPLDPYFHEHYRTLLQPKMSLSTLGRGILLHRVSARYGDVICLENISLTVMPGQLTVLIGQVGSGKSCMLHMMLKELPPYKGYLEVDGLISYASQEPWLFAGSVRQNILFGQDFEPERYREVVKVCALARDFTLLPYGDRTIVGERGISLSGGQRARVNLARAVYKKADVYLLDDPLSAVDTHVGKHIFEQCISGYLGSKVVILVTHQLQYLKSVAQIVIMNSGRIENIGTFDELKNSEGQYAKMLREQLTTDEKEPEPEEEAPKPPAAGMRPSATTITQSILQRLEEPKEVQEVRTKGAVDSHLYADYFRAGGPCCTVLFIICLFLGAQFFASGGDYFASVWVSIEELRDHGQSTDHIKPWGEFTREKLIIIYAGFIIATAIVALTRALIFFIHCMRASINLHDRMFFSISRATMRFFNTNPSGRILNRFSKDLNAIDEFLPNAMIDSTQIILNLVGCIGVLLCLNYYFLIPTVICCILFYIIRWYYLCASRSIKRLEGITRSPVFSHLNATLQGLTTIRTHGREMLLVEEFDNYQDVHSSSWFLFIATSRAFGYILDLICTAYMASVIIMYFTVPEKADGTLVGLAVTQCISVTGLFQWGMRQSAELENQMTSVERVLEFTKVEHEPPLESRREFEPPRNWPDEGRIEFINAVMRYSPTEAPVLKRVSFVIYPKEKVGIVGRTGAGKSSLIAALFRLAYFDRNSYVFIDDVNTLYIGLHDLRKKVSIIPQEPVLFSGSVRYNLDPFAEYNDYSLLAALTVVELKIALAEGIGCLDVLVTEGGANMSVGERQLICLARAIVRNNLILIMDEATANVDPQTDKFIQQTIRHRFAKCTVLTIAHRLNTVIDSDRILVMDAGQMVEYDAPHILLQDKNSFFSQMVDRTGTSMKESLKRSAEESYRAKQNAVQ